MEIKANREQLKEAMTRRTEILRLIQEYKDAVNAQRKVQKIKNLQPSIKRSNKNLSSADRSGAEFSVCSVEVPGELKESQSEGEIGEEVKVSAAFQPKRYQDIYHEAFEMRKKANQRKRLDSSF